MIKINYKSKFPIIMQLKTMYCCKCGNKLSKKALSSITLKQDFPLKKSIFYIGKKPSSLIYLTKIKNFSYLYKCENCNYLISYENQNKILKYQKKNKKIILNKSEIDDLKVSFKA